MAKKVEPVPAGGVWLTSLNGRLRVLVEVAGVWRVAIDEAGAFNADGTPYVVSHCANACGAYRWPADPILNESSEPREDS
jgi:hypothetical protein